ncbi:GTP-binding protein [Nesterenkonia pannonica]|uniref:GTP-binding protein n=1 Tax=Nesterenkonia pannonica TaxID=1548602 RepID=UPI0021648FAC|nr:GTP-binding protein [Nesterenkonia pannonica]
MVAGACGPERHQYARSLARREGRVLFDASRIARDPDAVVRWLHGRALSADPRDAVVEAPLHADMTHLIGEYADPGGGTQLSGIIAVVDALHLIADLRGEDYVVTDLTRRGVREEARFTARAQLMVQQVEYASAVVLVSSDGLSAQQVGLLQGLISHLSPHAAIVTAREEPAGRSGQLYTQDQTRPGWVCLLNSDFRVAHDHPRVLSLRYETPRAFHPERLKALLDGPVEHEEFGKLIRSSGFCRLATRPHITAHWEHVGTLFSMSPLTFDHQMTDPEEILAFRQDLALTGIDLDHEGLTSALDEALLTDEELAAGPSRWSSFADPFPGWATSSEADG